MEMATFLVLIGITWYHTAMAIANEPPISHRDPVSELRRACSACPSQWEGKVGRDSIYIRYRWLQVWIPNDEPEGAMAGSYSNSKLAPLGRVFGKREMKAHLVVRFRVEGSVSEEWE